MKLIPLNALRASGQITFLTIFLTSFTRFTVKDKPNLTLCAFFFLIAFNAMVRAIGFIDLRTIGQYALVLAWVELQTRCALFTIQIIDTFVAVFYAFGTLIRSGVLWGKLLLEISVRARIGTCLVEVETILWTWAKALARHTCLLLTLSAECARTRNAHGVVIGRTTLKTFPFKINILTFA